MTHMYDLTVVAKRPDRLAGLAGVTKKLERTAVRPPPNRVG
jgi:hypothetical protein